MGGAQVTETPINMVVLYVEELNEATAEAVGYVRSFAGRQFRAIHVRSSSTPPDFNSSWKQFSRTDVELEILSPRPHATTPVIDYVRGLPREEGDFVTVVIPELLPNRSLLSAVRRGTSFFLKVRLLTEPEVVVTDVPVVKLSDKTGVPPTTFIPERTVALVFVSGVNDAVVRAVNYARSLKATETRAVFFAFEPKDLEEIQAGWAERRIPVSLDIVEAPFRDLTGPVLEEVRRVTDRPGSVASVILPELVLPKFYQRFLHNQRPLFIKRLLLFEPNVILSSVPYHLGRS
jgi:hypothetical protein